jgi:Predicted transcriptional regulators
LNYYSTGELAKLANISVRTLQYYDRRNLLQPSALTTGGRRQYSDTDLDRLELILLLKDIGLSLKAIQEITTSAQADQTLQLLLNEQLQQLRADKTATQNKIKRIEAIQRQLPAAASAVQPLTTKSDIDSLIGQKQALHRVHRNMILLGILMDLIEFSGLIYALQTSNWWLLALVFILVLAIGSWVSIYYFRAVNYLCPNCRTNFRPQFRQAFFAPHNFKARKLTCPHCHQTNYCIEIAAPTN